MYGAFILPKISFTPPLVPAYTDSRPPFQKGASAMKGRWRYHPFYVKVRYGALQLIVPFIIFQFIRTLLFPTPFDVILLTLLALLYAAILCDWI